MSNAVRRIVISKRGDGNSKADSWRKEWAHLLKTKLPSCPCCKGKIEVRQSSEKRPGSETFHCEKDCGQIPVGWIDQSETKAEVLELMLKWKPVLINTMKDHIEESETVKKIVSKKAGKDSNKRGGVGALSGLKFSPAWGWAFKEALKNKLDDAHILALMEKDFPGKKNSKLSEEGVAKQRRRYNRGRISWQDGKVPASLVPQFVKGKENWRGTGAKGKKAAVKDVKHREEKKSSKPAKRRVVVVKRTPAPAKDSVK